MPTENNKESRRNFLRAAGAAGAAGAALGLAAQVRGESTQSMKITKITTYKFSVPTGQTVRDKKTGELLSSLGKPWLWLKLETDAGITGWGDGSGEWLTPSVEATIHAWKPLLIDRNPLEFIALTEDIQNRLPWKGGPVYATAIAAINTALYDLTGKAWGVPVHAILGGKKRDRIRVYTGGTMFDTPERAVEEGKRVKAAGFAGIKGNPLEGRTWPMDAGEVAHCTRCVAAMREALGPEFDILLDTHGSPTPELAIEYARNVAPYRPLFIEEPMKVGSVEALREISQKSPVAIATGEKLFSYRDFKPLIDSRACAFLQPDLGHCFGITMTHEIGRAAEHAQMLMAPHNASGPLNYAATLAVDSVWNNFLIQETHYFDRFSQFVEHDWEIKDGYVNMSDKPGLGLEVKEQDIAKLPYKQLEFRQYRHADGSWKGW